MTEIYDEHMTTHGAHKRFDQLQGQDYKPEYETYRVVASGSQDHAYLVGKVNCLSVPFEDADVTEDTETVYLCSCDDHWFNRSKNFENGDKPPSDIGKCKHISSEFAAIQAKNDKNQSTL